MSGTLPLRGRDGEFALIRELLTAARRGEGSVLVVRGKAGFGKTRLLQSAVEQAAALGLRTGAGGAEDGGQAVPMMTLTPRTLPPWPRWAGWHCTPATGSLPEHARGSHARP
jgi:hypothetical protein